MLASAKKSIKCKTSEDYITEITHNNITSHSQIQRDKTAEVSLFHQLRQDEEEELHLSVKEMIYSALDIVLKKFKKGRKVRKFSISTA